MEPPTALSKEDHEGEGGRMRNNDQEPSLALNPVSSAQAESPALNPDQIGTVGEQEDPDQDQGNCSGRRSTAELVEAISGLAIAHEIPLEDPVRERLKTLTLEQLEGALKLIESQMAQHCGFNGPTAKKRFSFAIGVASRFKP